MIKKIFFTLIIFFTIFSCGKKSDPVYEDPNKSTSKKLHHSINLNEIS